MICKSCGQDKRMMARGLCGKCYSRELDKENSAVCINCKEFRPIKSKSQGLCNKCYMRVKRNGDLSGRRKKKGDTLCTHCKTEPMHAKGFCNACYGRFRVTGSPEYKRRVLTCRASGCERKSTYNGYCDEHNSQAWNKEKASNSHLVRTYNITTEDYERMLKRQNKVCAICGELETRRYNGNIIKLAVDHCHDTGKVRGLLCSNCNIAIGRFNDSIKLLTKAINYLKL